MKKFNYLWLLLVLSICKSFGQPSQQLITVIVSPDHSDWTYKIGEKAKFTITVLEHGNVVKNSAIRYEVGPEKMEASKKDSLNLADGKLTIDGGTMKEPGFLRCIVTAYVNGKQYRGAATAGFDPLVIKPVIEMPSDFNQFWEKAKAEASAVPIDARMTLMPERCTEQVNVYHVNLQNYREGTRLYGILCIPKKEGKYPALLHVPGAGVRPYFGDVTMAEKGIITFEIGIHGVPVNMDREVYFNLGSGALRGYQNYNMDQPENFYFRRVYLGCVRANDFLFTLDQFDGKNLAVTGGSQGGALSIITASLDTRVKYLAAYYPALCDLTGYLKGRAGGWPHYFEKNSIELNNNNTKDKIKTCGYYDVVNFAKTLKVPGMYSWGFNDEVCPPTSMYAAYNSINAPKSLLVMLQTGHWTYPEQKEKMDSWLVEKLTGK